MALAKDLIRKLKVELRQNGLTYADVAKHLGLSESSVKRLFRDQDMSLSRLESICSLVGLEINDLAQKAELSQRTVTVLTRQQEELLVGDEKLFLLAVHLIYGWSYEQIMETFDLDVHEVQRRLTQLDKLKILQLLPDNRVRILLSTEFEWIKGGPIQQFFQKSAQGRFFESEFTGLGELRLVLNGWMSVESTAAFHGNMRRLAHEFELHKEQDRHAPANKRRGTSLVVAIRPWSLELFEKYRTNPVPLQN